MINILRAVTFILFFPLYLLWRALPYVWKHVLLPVLDGLLHILEWLITKVLHPLFKALYTYLLRPLWVYGIRRPLAWVGRHVLVPFCCRIVWPTVKWIWRWIVEPLLLYLLYYPLRWVYRVLIRPILPLCRKLVFAIGRVIRWLWMRLVYRPFRWLFVWMARVIRWLVQEIVAPGIRWFRQLFGR